MCRNATVFSEQFFDFIFETNRSRVLALWNLVVCFVVLLSTLNPLGSLYESQSGCGPAFGFRPGIMKSLYYPNTVNITDLMIEPQKYCRVHELLVSLTGSEQILKNKLSYVSISYQIYSL